MVREDVHVHSTYSDGTSTVEESVRRARHARVERLVVVDHVSPQTRWVPDLVREVERLRKDTGYDVRSGLEVNFADATGRLALPEDFDLADHLYVADHRLPVGHRCLLPEQVRELLRRREVKAADVVESLVRALEGTLREYRRVVLAHLFGSLAKVGIAEHTVSRESLLRIAWAAKHAELEVNERWRCPAVRTVGVFRDAGVRIRAGTDSHGKETIGRYRYVAAVYRELGL